MLWGFVIFYFIFLILFESLFIFKWKFMYIQRRKKMFWIIEKIGLMAFDFFLLNSFVVKD